MDIITWLKDGSHLVDNINKKYYDLSAVMSV